ncbi:MAG: penicillin acylase family protein [Alphaproteobacteria bacterium]|nr:penicillin acylase family protein [Alphaproteobacteria bacterium]
MGLVSLFLSACSALSPSEVSREERLKALPTHGLPLEGTVTVRWNAQAVPFIEASSDRDLAFELGLVQAHLRLAQIRILKQAAQGRLSEMAGPFAQDIDFTIRILDFGRAASEMVKRMPPETKMLMQAFADGLNYYQDHLEEMPPEFGLLGLEPEPFSIEDLLTIGRLAGTDVNWLAYISLLPARNRKEWPEIWARALDAGSGPTTSFPNPEQQAAATLLLSFAKSGSNSFAVAPSKSASGAAMIANDPHLGVTVPNLWILAGIKSPSFNAVGFMIPGLPFIALGRTPDLAWGGTNMRAANSDLYDIAGLADAGISEETITIKTRFWFDAERTLRRSRLGGVLSDSSLISARPGETLALRWVGHEPTDEVTALFAVMRAKDAYAFRAALSNFAVSPQNLLCADSAGNICHVLATVIPKRPFRTPLDLVLDARDKQNEWGEMLDARTLPFAINPPEGFLASSNNRPTDTPYPIGYFFNADERIRRIKEMLSASGPISVEDLMRMQQDTVSPASRQLANDLVAAIEAFPRVTAVQPEFLNRLKSFQGDYRADAAGPVAFETLLYHLVPAVYGFEDASELPPYRQEFAVLVYYLPGDLAALPAERRELILADAINKASNDAAEFPSWGDMHRLEIDHVLSSVPVLGSFFKYADYPTGGSRETVMKTAHGLINEKSGTRYGAQARHISDMGDLDANYFVLLGGNDGWLGSLNALDQVDLWREGQYIRMPLRPETVAQEFPDVTVLSP